ncbi:MAG: type II toxin-antitoxin system VapC family toxin [Lachnospiraceae bacterium]|nr:type II toxin-antitoxin system VapC family toxin [Lachnospiraceae bacterium]
MKYMLDTNICIYTIKHKPETVLQNFLLHDPEEICISAITYAELLHGVEKSGVADINRIALSLFLSPLTVLDYSASAAEEYGKIRAGLERRRTPIGPMDLLIAAHARAERLVLVTNHTEEFWQVEGLAVENWT